VPQHRLPAGYGHLGGRALRTLGSGSPQPKETCVACSTTLPQRRPKQQFRSRSRRSHPEDYDDLPPVIVCYKLNGEWLTPNAARRRGSWSGALRYKSVNG